VYGALERAYFRTGLHFEYSRCRSLDTINTLKAYQSESWNNDAAFTGFAAFANQADGNLASRMRAFAWSCGIFNDDAIADRDAFITYECRRAGNELSNRALRITAERATKLPLPEEAREG
jgi:hypothetical protein